MEHFESDKNKIFFGSYNKLADWESEKLSQNNIIDKVKLMLKNYLELDNASFLFGSGSSIHLGAVAIRDFPLEVEAYIKEKETETAGLLSEFYKTIKALQANRLAYGNKNLIGDTQKFKESNGWEFMIDDEIIRDVSSKEIATEYEKILNYS